MTSLESASKCERSFNDLGFSVADVARLSRIALAVTFFEPVDVSDVFLLALRKDVFRESHVSAAIYAGIARVIWVVCV